MNNNLEKYRAQLNHIIRVSFHDADENIKYCKQTLIYDLIKNLENSGKIKIQVKEQPPFSFYYMDKEYNLVADFFICNWSEIEKIIENEVQCRLNEYKEFKKEKLKQSIQSNIDYMERGLSDLKNLVRDQ